MPLKATTMHAGRETCHSSGPCAQEAQHSNASKAQGVLTKKVCCCAKGRVQGRTGTKIILYGGILAWMPRLPGSSWHPPPYTSGSRASAGPCRPLPPPPPPFPPPRRLPPWARRQSKGGGSEISALGGAAPEQGWPAGHAGSPAGLHAFWRRGRPPLPCCRWHSAGQYGPQKQSTAAFFGALQQARSIAHGKAGKKELPAKKEGKAEKGASRTPPAARFPAMEGPQKCSPAVSVLLPRTRLLHSALLPGGKLYVKIDIIIYYHIVIINYNI